MQGFDHGSIVQGWIRIGAEKTFDVIQVKIHAKKNFKITCLFLIYKKQHYLSTDPVVERYSEAGASWLPFTDSSPAFAE